MNKYKVEFTQLQKFIVDVMAVNQEEATTKAKKEFDSILVKDMQHYHEVGDSAVDVSMVYDVTETDDPFDPINPK